MRGAASFRLGWSRVLSAPSPQARAVTAALAATTRAGVFGQQSRPLYASPLLSWRKDNVAGLIGGSSIAVATAAAPVRSRLHAAESMRMLSTPRPDHPNQVTIGKLRDNPGARKKKRRLGRGIGGGLGKTSGRGHKGQLSRSGGRGGRRGFEGGQNPLKTRIPKHGFRNKKHAYFALLDTLNLNKLLTWVKAGRLDTTQMITMKHLRDNGCIAKTIDKGVKLLATGKEQVDRPIQIEVSDASKAAIEAIEAAGGTVKRGYYNALGLRAHFKPDKFTIIPRRAAPPPRLAWKYPLHYKDVQAQLAARGEQTKASA
mmetsp:Transcript_53089/g.125403  ORF Transcript_53089/g.125403 Transcript_53089/m.125403 type:complete len:314 (+) Transcript_53089:119-1060(+)